MSKVAKYRRQVSEDPDIDSLLSTLSPEEMEELEKELDVVDPDGSVPVGLRQRGPTARPCAGACDQEATLSLREEQPKKLVHRELPVDDGTRGESKADAKSREEKGGHTSKDAPGPRQDADPGREPRRGVLRKSFSRDKDSADGKGAEPPKAEKVVRATDRGRVRAVVDKTEAGGDARAAPREEEEQRGAGRAEDKRREDAERGARADVGQEGGTAGKRGASPAREPEPPRKGAAAAEGQAPAGGPGPEDGASSVFDEPLERVRSNDPTMTEVNVNNSDCITTEVLVRFAEALEFNTAVRVFALANTRADDHVAFAIAIMLKANKTITSLNLDSNHITGKGILAIFRALLQNSTLTELRFHNQRHICGGKTEMEMAQLLRDNGTLLKLGYHFELAGPRMAVTGLLSRNMDRQRQKRLQEQRQAQAAGGKAALLDVPKAGAPAAGSPGPSPQPSPKASPKNSPKKGAAPAAPPPPPPPLAPPLIMESLRDSLSPATQRKMGDRVLPAQEKNSRDQLLAAIRSSNLKQLKKWRCPNCCSRTGRQGSPPGPQGPRAAGTPGRRDPTPQGPRAAGTPRHCAGPTMAEWTPGPAPGGWRLFSRPFLVSESVSTWGGSFRKEAPLQCITEEKARPWPLVAGQLQKAVAQEPCPTGPTAPAQPTALQGRDPGL